MAYPQPITEQIANLIDRHPDPHGLGVTGLQVGSMLRSLQQGTVGDTGFVASALSGEALRTATVTGTVVTTGTAVTVTSTTGGLVATAPDAILYSIQGNAYVTNAGVAVSGGEVTFTVDSAVSGSAFTIVFAY